MKLNPISTRQPISSTERDLRRPTPPTPEMVERAKFVDKTYRWKNAGLRPGKQRSSQ